MNFELLQFTYCLSSESELDSTGVILVFFVDVGFLVDGAFDFGFSFFLFWLLFFVALVVARYFVGFFTGSRYPLMPLGH